MLTNRQWAAAVAIVVAAVGGWLGYLHWRDHRFDKLIVAAAARYQLDPALIKAVIWRESRFSPNARGRAGELGLMQIREVAALEWAGAERLASFDHSACLDPATNILAGSWYLRGALRRYGRTDNPAAFALADYNAGRGNVLKWQTGAATTNSRVFVSQIQFPRTREYVLAISERAESYRREGEFRKIRF